MAEKVFGFDEKFLSGLKEMFDNTRVEEIEIEDEECYLRISKYSEHECHHNVVPSAQPVQTQAVEIIEKPSSIPSATQVTQLDSKTEEYDDAKYVKVKSPLVGTFYEAPSPTSPPFVKIGDMVMPDTTVCIVEAMKVMNEIKAEAKGKIVKVLKTNGSPVKDGEVLFIIEKM